MQQDLLLAGTLTRLELGSLPAGHLDGVLTVWHGHLYLSLALDLIRHLSPAESKPHMYAPAGVDEGLLASTMRPQRLPVL